MSASMKSRRRSRKTDTPYVDVYERVTNTIIEAIESGVLKQWTRPWRTKQGEIIQHRNAVSKRPYRGINTFLLEVSATVQGFHSPLWVTFNGAKALGGAVRKGEKGTLVTLWKPFKKEVEDPTTGEKKLGSFLLLKHYTVFNIDQCDDLNLAAPVQEDPDEPEDTFEYNLDAESIWHEFAGRPTLRHRGNRASYSPLADIISMPEREQFSAADSYYATLFHEAIHSTGHEDRLHRVKDWTAFGSEPYAQEELVAEMGAAMLCGVVGIDSQLDQSAAYIEHWAEKIKEATSTDKRWLVTAAARAQRAADHILGAMREDQPRNGEAA